MEADKSTDVELEFWPQPLAWDSIWLTVGAGDTYKEILRGCSGEVLPGEMMAIVGPSGKKLLIVHIFGTACHERFAFSTHRAGDLREHSLDSLHNMLRVLTAAYRKLRKK